MEEKIEIESAISGTESPVKRNQTISLRGYLRCYVFLPREEGWIHRYLALFLPPALVVNRSTKYQEWKRIEIESAISRNRIPQSKEIKRILHANLCPATFPS